MAGIKGKGGIKGRSGQKPGSLPGPGRTPRSLAGLDDAIKSVLQTLPEASTLVAEPVIWYCHRCGAWGWERINVTVWGDNFGEVEGSTPLSTATIDGRPVQHRKGCPNK